MMYPMPYYVIQACDINFYLSVWHSDKITIICNLISVSDLFLYLLLLHLIFIFIEKNRFKIFQNGEVYRLGIFDNPFIAFKGISY